MKKQRGISLIELVLVIAAIGFLILLITNLPSSLASISRSQHQSLAGDIASKQLELLRKQGYSGLSNGSGTFVDTNLSQLPGASTAYQISDCPANVCTNQELAKFIEVTVNWKETKEQKKVTLSTLVSDKGVGQ